MLVGSMANSSDVLHKKFNIIMPLNYEVLINWLTTIAGQQVDTRNYKQLKYYSYKTIHVIQTIPYGFQNIKKSLCENRTM